jgi:hypothetical protein
MELGAFEDIIFSAFEGITGEALGLKETGFYPSIKDT